MSQTVRVKTARPSSRRRGGYGNTYHQKRNHSSVSNDYEKQQFFEEEHSSVHSNRNDNKRGKGPYHLKKNITKENYNGQLNFYETLDGKFVQQDQESCNFLEARCNKSSKRANAQRSLSPLSGNKYQAVSDSSVKDESLTATNLSKPPKHAQNPIFVEELVNRFHSILPPSTIPPAEEAPKKILSNQDCFKNPNKTRDYDLPSINKTPLKKNNPHYPFLHCNMEPHFSHDEDSRSELNRGKCLKFEPHEYNKKNTQNLTTTNSKIVKEMTYSKSNESNHKQSNEHQARPEPSLGNSLFSNMDAFHLHDHSRRQIETNHQSFKPSGNIVHASTVNNSQDQTILNQTQTSEDSIEFDLFSQIKAFVSNNRSTSHKPNLSNSCLEFASRNIQEKNNPKFCNELFIDGSTSSLKTTFNQTQPSTSNIENGNKTLNSSGINSQTINDEMSNDTYSPNHKKVDHHEFKTSRNGSLYRTPSSFTNSNKMSAQDGNSSDNFSSMKSPNSNKPSNGTAGFVSKRNDKNKHCKDHHKRNEILKSFGFPGKPMSQNIERNAAEQRKNTTSEIVTLPQEKTLKSNKISPDDKGNTSGSAVRRTHHSQPESFQKHLELSGRKTNIQNNTNNSGSSNSPHEFLKSTGNLSSYELPFSSQMHSVKNHLPHPKNTFDHEHPKINRNDSEINVNKCTHPSIINNSDLNNAEVAGGNVYNIQQPANVPTQRVATRTEAIRRLQDHYAEDLVEYQQKEKEKAAKKLEQKLARYKYVDQGYRLNEGYLDEAAGGFDPDAAQFVESEEEVRMRQQEQLSRDAFVYMELEKKKNEQLKNREEEKKKKEMEKYKHITHGYRLGSSENLVDKKVASDTSGGCGTSAATAVATQAAMAQARIRAAGNQGLGVPGLASRPVSNEGIRVPDTMVGLNPDGGARPRTRRPEILSPQIDEPNSLQKNLGGPAINVQESHTVADSSQSAVKSIADIDATFLKFLHANGVLNQTDNKEAENLRLTLLSQLQNVLINTNQKSIYETQTPVSGNAIKIETNVDMSIKPAAHVVKSAGEGPTLIIRPSQQALEQSISQRLAVQDFDKHGQSTLYAPQVEQEPKYFNNRFQQKPSTKTPGNTFEHVPEIFNEARQNIMPNVVESDCTQQSFDEVAESIGAIPKQNQPEKNLQASSSSTTSSNEPETSDANFQEDLRAARLRMQQKYDEALKQQINC